MNQLQEFPINLNYMEFGYLFATIKEETWNKMPRSLWLKLQIHSTKAYLKHKSLGQQAARDIKRWENELKILNK